MPKGYGINPRSAKGMIEWPAVSEQLRKSRNYWIGTTRPDGRPHVMPVWGVWVEDKLYFSTHRRSRKARNLAANPAVVAHLESGDDVVIVEGTAREVASKTQLAPVDDAYFAKYKMRLSDIPAGSGIDAVEPHVVFAWREKDFPASTTRWLFETK
ncbi:MAG: pyridoxamine 5'-phosphate oxidase family protein [Acidobacteria bacterium]|nr:pyridoxamine 5'-phosphate oxidase family protein [Acidobacteriota bacterium]